MANSITDEPQVVNISRFFIGIIDDKYPLKTYVNEKNRLMFNLMLETTGQGLSEERYRYHKNQFVTGEWIVQYNKPDENGWQLKHYRQLPSGIPVPQHKLATLLYGTSTQLDPSKFGLTTHVDEFTRSILVNFT